MPPSSEKVMPGRSDTCTTFEAVGTATQSVVVAVQAVPDGEVPVVMVPFDSVSAPWQLGWSVSAVSPQVTQNVLVLDSRICATVAPLRVGVPDRLKVIVPPSIRLGLLLPVMAPITAVPVALPPSVAVPVGGVVQPPPVNVTNGAVTYPEPPLTIVTEVTPPPWMPVVCWNTAPHSTVASPRPMFGVPNEVAGIRSTAAGATPVTAFWFPL